MKISNNRIIYIIDDDTDDQELLIEALHTIDSTITCYTAINGQEGITKLLLKAVPKPQLIFADLNMPRVDGKQFLRRIKQEKELKHIPVIIYSTTSDVAETRELIQMGAAYFIKKPYNFESLIMEVRLMLDLNLAGSALDISS